MEEKTIEQKITDIHDAMIRLEPVIRDVERIRKWKDGNGMPGAQFQVWVMWCVFVIIAAKIWG